MSFGSSLRRASTVLLLSGAGCSLFGFETAPDGDEVAALKAEVASLRAELAELREEVDVAHDVVALTPPPSRTAAQRADFDRLDHEVGEVGSVVDAVDLDLDIVEGLVQDLQSRLAVAEAQVASLEGIINNHADVLDALSSELGALEEETANLRPLNDLMFFDDGKIFVDGVDMVFRPGTNPDGSARSTGPVMVRPPIE